MSPLLAGRRVREPWAPDSDRRERALAAGQGGPEAAQGDREGYSGPRYHPLQPLWGFRGPLRCTWDLP